MYHFLTPRSVGDRGWGVGTPRSIILSVYLLVYQRQITPSTVRRTPADLLRSVSRHYPLELLPPLPHRVLSGPSLPCSLHTR